MLDKSALLFPLSGPTLNGSTMSDLALNTWALHPKHLLARLPTLQFSDESFDLLILQGSLLSSRNNKSMFHGVVLKNR